MTPELLNILLVEDNPADARLIEILLKEAGGQRFVVTCAQTGQEAKRLMIERRAGGSMAVDRWAADRAMAADSARPDSSSGGVSGPVTASGSVDASPRGRRTVDWPNVILLDLGLPDVAQEEAVKWMQAISPKTPIVVLSGMNDEAVAMSAVREGAQDYLVKGRIDADLLRRSIRYAVERQRAAVALHESEERFERFMRHSPAAAFMKDESGRYLYGNVLFEEVHGLQPGGWMGKSDEDLLPPEVAKVLQANDRAVLNRDVPMEINEVIPGPTGPREWLTLKFPIRTGDGQRCLGGMAVDITSRVRAEEALREAESARVEAVQQQSDTLNALPAQVALVDVAGNIIVVNDAWRRFSVAAGWPQDRFADGWNYLEVVKHATACEDATFVEAGLIQVLSGERTTFTHEYRCEAPGAGPQWFAVIVSGLSGQGKRGAVVMHLDVTDRKLAQERLARTESRYRSVVETAQEGVWLADREGKAILVNQRMAAMLGLPAGELMGQELMSFATRGSSDQSAADAAERPARAPTELCLRHHDGRDVWVSISSSTVFDESGGEQGTLKMITDINERRAAEKALREADEQLRQAQKMEAVGQLASGVAHDFNNLLTAIRGYTSLARSSLQDNHPARQSLDQVEEASRQAAGVAGALLTFARKKRAEKAPVLLATVLEGAARLFRGTLGPRIKLNVDVSRGKGLWVNADETQLHQVITNLAINARDAITGSGEINIVLGPHADGAGKTAAIRVSDTGSGMSDEVRDRIFEPFFTTKARGSGTGLGLSVIHGIVQEHGGEIIVESSPGQGSSFTVLLACIAPPGNVVEAKPATEPGSLPAGPVLVVQNSPMVRGVVASMLSTIGYETIHASNAAEALTILGAGARPVPFFVADIALADASAIELLDRLREIHSAMRCVIIADLGGDDTNTKPGVVYLRKPFRVGDLDAAIHRLFVDSGEGPEGSAERGAIDPNVTISPP